MRFYSVRHLLAQLPKVQDDYSQVTGKNRAEDIVKGAVDGSKIVNSLFEQDWIDLLNGNSPIYGAVVGTSLLIAVVLVAFWSVKWYMDISENGLSIQTGGEIIYPLVVILMLSVNNGIMLAKTSFMFREISNGLNEKVLDMTRNGISLRNSILIANIDQTSVQAVVAASAECQKKPEEIVDDKGVKTKPREACIKEKQQTMQQAVDAYGKETKTPKPKKGFSFSRILKFGDEIVNNSVQFIIQVLLSGIEIAFQYVIQISFLLNAYIGPVFLVLSLLPLGAKPIHAWLSGWLALGLLKISYSILVGMTASSIINTPSTNPLVHQLMAAIFSPIIAIAIATGGGMAVFSGVTSSAKTIFNTVRASKR
ncbi:hypothetical protein WKK05_37635 (plasmid) [Nostoc sp. UHCC 0302]|uniref:hypothetical protein n=1 Tax=Nostoc sp. UHCC 0302 TaxID=3134896 RepID=UPI00311CC7C5